MKRNNAIDEAGEFHEFVSGFIDVCAQFKFAFIVKQVNVVHFSEAFSAAVSAIISYFKVFFTATFASTCF